MRTAIVIAMLLGLASASQAQVALNLDHLAKKARESVDINLDANLLTLAGRFLSAEKPDEAKAKALVSGLKGVYVRSFEFDAPGAYTAADLSAISNQFSGPQWTRVVRHVAGKGKETEEIASIFIRQEAGKSTGIAIVAAEPKQLTVVQILGEIDLDKLGDLSGQFGIPKLPKAGK